MTRSGMEYSSPQSRRNRARTEKAQKEEKEISNKNAKSLTRGIQGFVMGSLYMDAKDSKERNDRQRSRNLAAKKEEKSITAKLRRKK